MNIPNSITIPFPLPSLQQPLEEQTFKFKSKTVFSKVCLLGHLHQNYLGCSVTVKVPGPHNSWLRILRVESLNLSDDCVTFSSLRPKALKLCFVIYLGKKLLDMNILQGTETKILIIISSNLHPKSGYKFFYHLSPKFSVIQSQMGNNQKYINM